MANWCVLFPEVTSPKRKKSSKADNGFWCEFSKVGNVTVDYNEVTYYDGSGEGTVVNNGGGSFVFTPPAGLTSFSVRLFGGGGGGGGGDEGESSTFGYDGKGGFGGYIGADNSYTITGTPVFDGSQTFTMQIGNGGGGAGGGGYIAAGGTTTFDIYTASGGATGASGSGYGDSDTCSANSHGTVGQSSSQGSGGAGGNCKGGSEHGGTGGTGGISSGGGGGGGGGGGMYPGDPGAGGGNGGSGGSGRIKISWDIHITPTINAPGDMWCVVPQNIWNGVDINPNGYTFIGDGDGTVDILDGTGIFTVPDGVTQVNVCMTAAAGSGSSALDEPSFAYAGGGLRGESLRDAVFAVTPGELINISVGTGGLAVTGTFEEDAEGMPGGDSSFGPSTVLGGLGGTWNGYLGNGEAYSSPCSPDVNFDGIKNNVKNAFGGQSGVFGNGGNGSSYGDGFPGDIGAGGGGVVFAEDEEKPSGAGGNGRINIRWRQSSFQYDIIS